jgi:crossover junction endodeoxyribonuclease RusA
MSSRQRRPPSRSSHRPVRVTSYRPSEQSPLQRLPPLAQPQDRSAILGQLRRAPRNAGSQGPLADPIITPDGLRITLPVPPSVNHQYATVNGRRLLSSAGRNYKTHVGHQLWVALTQSPYRMDLLHRLQSGPLALSIRFFFTSALRRDVDGGLKIAQDALCEGLGINDNRIIETHLYKDVDKINPRMEMSLSPSATSLRRLDGTIA